MRSCFHPLSNAVEACDGPVNLQTSRKKKALPVFLVVFSDTMSPAGEKWERGKFAVFSGSLLPGRLDGFVS